MEKFNLEHVVFCKICGKSIEYYSFRGVHDRHVEAYHCGNELCSNKNVFEDGDDVQLLKDYDFEIREVITHKKCR